MSRDFITNIQILEDELTSILEDLDNDNPQQASDFFARFGFADLYYGNRFFEVLDRGHEILHLIARINPEKYKTIHKGYPFYWMGMAAYRIHDFQSAVYYIDATLSEDLEIFPHVDNTPPRLFLRLEGDNEKQAALHLVKGAQEGIEEYINVYNGVIQKTNPEIPGLTLTDVRNSFLKLAVSSKFPNVRSLASTFITFFLELKYRDFQLSLRNQPGTNEPFFVHLFKGCLLFESLLKSNPTKKVVGSTLGKVLVELRDELNLPEMLRIGNKTLSNVLRGVLDADDDISRSIQLTASLRNTIGHDMSWPMQLSRDQYLNSFLHIEFSCLHAIATLFRPARSPGDRE